MASNPSKDKGTRAETVVRDLLRKHTGLKFERTPGSGALDEKHKLKGDLYIPDEGNLFCIEVKHYADDHFNSTLFTSKNPQLLQWWEQAVRQGDQVSRKPLLIFKHDRSKVFVAYTDMPENGVEYAYIEVKTYSFFVSLLEDWLTLEKPKFIK